MTSTSPVRWLAAALAGPAMLILARRSLARARRSSDLLPARRARRRPGDGDIGAVPAYAALAQLGRDADSVLVATHDVELLDLLDERHAPFHFREQIADGALVADARAALDWQRGRGVHPAGAR